MHSEKPIYAPPRVSEVSQNSSSIPFRLTDAGSLSLSSFEGGSSSASSFHASLVQATNGVVSLALCPQVVSQAPYGVRHWLLNLAWRWRDSNAFRYADIQ